MIFFCFSTSALVINPEEDCREVLEIENFPAQLKTLKSEMNSLMGSNPEIYPEFVFLGTGSCIPNKTRNTSAILVHTE